MLSNYEEEVGGLCGHIRAMLPKEVQNGIGLFKGRMGRSRLRLGHSHFLFTLKSGGEVRPGATKRLSAPGGGSGHFHISKWGLRFLL